MKFQIGDQVILGELYYCGYEVMKIDVNRELDVMISRSASLVDAFWVSSKDLNFIG